MGVVWPISTEDFCYDYWAVMGQDMNLLIAVVEASVIPWWDSSLVLLIN